MAFYCPQCGIPIKEFNVDVGQVGYRMEAICPQCRVAVTAMVEGEFIDV